VYLSWNPDESGYAEAASAAGMTPGTFRVAVHRMRRRFRSFLENEVARTVDTEADLKEEIAYLLHVMDH
jgi:RNA polymerase sigma-70 factor (ECF subfamily)